VNASDQQASEKRANLVRALWDAGYTNFEAGAIASAAAVVADSLRRFGIDSAGEPPAANEHGGIMNRVLWDVGTVGANALVAALTDQQASK